MDPDVAAEEALVDLKADERDDDGDQQGEDVGFFFLRQSFVAKKRAKVAPYDEGEDAKPQEAVDAKGTKNLTEHIGRFVAEEMGHASIFQGSLIK